MRIRFFWPVCGLWVAMLASTARSDVDPADYQLKSSVRSEQERARLEAGFALDRQQEAAAQQQEEDRAAQQRLAEKAAWDALPYPLRLTRTRCTACHLADNYVNQRHNRVGWELVILRMQYLNQAVLEPGERTVVAQYLAQSYPAEGLAAWAEGLQQLAALLVPLGCWWVWLLLRPRLGKLRRGSSV